MSQEDWVYAKQWFSSKEYPPLPAPPGDIWQCLGMFMVVLTRVKVTRGM